MTPPKLVSVLSETATLTPSRDLRTLAWLAVEAEDARIDAVMASEHIVLGYGRCRSLRSRGRSASQDLPAAMTWRIP